MNILQIPAMIALSFFASGTFGTRLPLLQETSAPSNPKLGQPSLDLNPHGQIRFCPNGYTKYVSGNVTINCSDKLVVNKSVCEEASVSFEYTDGMFITYSTGAKVTDCVDVMIPPNTKVWWEYETKFSYTYSGYTKKCTLLAKATGNRRFMSAPATSMDCG